MISSNTLFWFEFRLSFARKCSGSTTILKSSCTSRELACYTFSCVISGRLKSRICLPIDCRKALMSVRTIFCTCSAFWQCKRKSSESDSKFSFHNLWISPGSQNTIIVANNLLSEPGNWNREPSVSPLRWYLFMGFLCWFRIFFPKVYQVWFSRLFKLVSS